MGNGIQPFFGDRLSAGDAFPESAIGNSLKRSLNRPDFHQPGISKTLQNLVTFILDDTLVYSDSDRAADRSSRIDRTGRSDHLVTALKDASSVNYGVA